MRQSQIKRLFWYPAPVSVMSRNCVLCECDDNTNAYSGEKGHYAALIPTIMMQLMLFLEIAKQNAVEIWLTKILKTFLIFWRSSKFCGNLACRFTKDFSFLEITNNFSSLHRSNLFNLFSLSGLFLRNYHKSSYTIIHPTTNVSEDFTAALQHLKSGKNSGPNSIFPELVNNAGAGLKSCARGFVFLCLRHCKI